jgi:hypothetical protein
MKARVPKESLVEMAYYRLVRRLKGIKRIAWRGIDGGRGNGRCPAQVFLTVGGGGWMRPAIMGVRRAIMGVRRRSWGIRFMRVDNSLV